MAALSQYPEFDYELEPKVARWAKYIGRQLFHPTLHR